MDAKPQRPLRSFKVRDENLPPSNISGKSIHQRNKSSPALSSLAQQHAVLKTGPRRTAFADLSNTNKANQGAKDDSVIASTKSALESLKEVATTQENSNKHAPLLRPAQRPLSVSGIRGFLNTFASTSSTTTMAAKIPVQSLINAYDQPPADNGFSKPKKNTTVFKDPTPQIPESTAPQQIAPSVSAYTEKEIIKEIRLETKENFPQERRPSTGSSYLPLTYEHRLPPLPSSSDFHDIRSDGVRLSSSYGLPASYSAAVIDDVESYRDTAVYALPDREPLQAIDENFVPQGDTRNEDILPVLPLAELGEYWEQEAYGGKYDDDDYTTARSVKSREEYTTGATTIVIAPRITAKVEKELAAAKKFVLESRTVDEIEEDESWDTSMVAEYGEEIFDYMRVLEERMRPNPYYMDNQTEVQWSMRSVLMDWLVQVHNRFQLLPETLFLCVNYIDRFLSCKVVSLGKLQLVGATAIFVAAKYEEINCPSVSEIQYMVDGGYTIEEILKAERFMLSMLQFELGWPGPMSFLRRISKADDYDLETRTLAKYFLELTIMDERFVGCIPSFTAAGAHCLARLMLGKGLWSQEHIYYSNYTYSQLRPLLLAMLSCCEDPQKHHSAIFDKYGDKRFKRASFFVQSEMNKGFELPHVHPTVARSLHWGNGMTGAENDWRFGLESKVDGGISSAGGRFL